eukprot:76020-Rhodomonas_salina.3
MIQHAHLWPPLSTFSTSPPSFPTLQHHSPRPTVRHRFEIPSQPSIQSQPAPSHPSLSPGPPA